MTTPRITDSHCHLDFPDFADSRPDVIARALDAGVHRMVTICTKLANEPAVRAIAEDNDAVFYAAGVHPMSAADHPPVTTGKSIGVSPEGWHALHGLSVHWLPAIRQRWRRPPMTGHLTVLPSDPMTAPGRVRAPE